MSTLVSAFDFILIERALAGFDKSVDVAGPTPSISVAIDVVEFIGCLTSSSGVVVNVRVTIFSDLVDVLIYEEDFETELEDLAWSHGNYAGQMAELVARYTA